MDAILAGLTANLLSPIVLFFVIGLAAALARSDLSIPEPFAKALSLYLMLAIGFKGGAEVARVGPDVDLLLLVGAGVATNGNKIWRLCPTCPISGCRPTTTRASCLPCCRRARPRPPYLPSHRPLRSPPPPRQSRRAPASRSPSSLRQQR